MLRGGLPKRSVFFRGSRGLDSGSGLIMGDSWRLSNGFNMFRRPFLWVVLGCFSVGAGSIIVTHNDVLLPTAYVSLKPQ